MIIIVDDEHRKNEGDLVCAADKVTPEIINFMARHARGLICLPLTEERCDELHLTTQVADNTSYLETVKAVPRYEVLRRAPPDHASRRQHLIPRHCLHSFDRCASRYHDRNLGCGSGHNDSGSGRSTVEIPVVIP